MNTRFSTALLHPKEGDIGFIAEIKLQSPKSGVLGKREEMEKRIKTYEKGGADALSLVVARKRFGGDPGMIEEAKKVTHLPIFAKDFIEKDRQISLLKEKGADAVLLIAKIVDRKKLAELVEIALELAVEPVVEVQNEEELENARATNTNIIAVNARDVNNFSIDMDAACALLKHIPMKYIKLAFSGVRTRHDVLKYKDAGAQGVLVGTTLMESDRSDVLVKELKGLCISA